MVKKFNSYKDIYAIVLLVLLVIGFNLQLFYPSLQIYITPDYGHSEIIHNQLPNKYFLSENLKNNTLPLWNKHIGSGFPQLAEGGIGTFYFSNLLLFKFLPFPLSFNISYILAFIITAIGIYLLARKLSFSYLTSIFVSITFTFSGYMSTKTPNLNLIQAISIVPYIFLLVFIYIKSKKIIYLPLLSLIIAQQFFTGFPQVFLITMVGIMILLIHYKFIKLLSYKHFGLIILFILIGLSISAVQLLPSLEYLKETNRKNGFEFEVATYTSYLPKHIITLINPTFLGDPKTGSYPDYKEFNGNIFWENTAYIGIIPVFLIFLTFRKIRKNSLVTYFWILLIISGLLMSGKYSPFYFIFTFPPFNYFKAPSRFILLFTWSLVFLSGIGFDIFLQKLNKTKYKNVLAIGIILFTLFQLYLFSSKYNPVKDAKDILKRPESVDYLKKSTNRYFTLGSNLIWDTILINKGWSKSQEEYLYLKNGLQPNINILYNISSHQIDPILTTTRFNYYESKIREGMTIDKDIVNINDKSLKLLALNNVSNIISIYNIQNLIKESEIKSNYKNIPDYKIYKINQFSPRAYLVGNYETASTIQEMFRLINDQEFEPKKSIILEKKIPYTNYTNLDAQSSLATDQIKWILDKDKEIVLQVLTNQDKLLVLADTYYPGWKAYVNGRITEIYAADIIHRAIKIPSGTSEVKFIYQPDSFRIGLIISIVSVLFIVFLLVPQIVLLFENISRSISLTRFHF